MDPRTHRRGPALLFLAALALGGAAAARVRHPAAPPRPGPEVAGPHADPGDGNPAPDSDAPRLVEIRVGDDLRFSPASAALRMGDTVEWIVTGSMPHTVTDTPGAAAVREHTVLPAGAMSWNSGLLNQGARYRQVLRIRGTYAYVCLLHEASAMLGTLIVR